MKDDKDSRYIVQKQNKREQESLKREIESLKKKERIMDIIREIKESHRLKVYRVSERVPSKYLFFYEDANKYFKFDCLVTTIKSGDADYNATTRITEKGDDLDIHYEVFSIDNIHIPKETLTFEKYYELGNEFIMESYKKLIEKNK